MCTKEGGSYIDDFFFSEKIGKQKFATNFMLIRLLEPEETSFIGIITPNRSGIEANKALNR